MPSLLTNGFSALCLLAVGGEDSEQSSIPASIQGLREQVVRLDGPVRFSVRRTYRELKLGSKEDRAELDPVLNMLVEAARSGEAPRFVDGLDLFRRWCALPLDDVADERGAQLWVEYLGVGDDSLVVREFEGEHFSSELALGGLYVEYQSGTGQVLARTRGAGDGKRGLNLSRLLYPVGVGAASGQWLDQVEWASVGSSSYVSTDPGGAAWSFSFEADSDWPTSALLEVERDGAKRHVLTLFRLAPHFARTRNGLGVYEVLQFDSLALEGFLSLEHFVVFDCQLTEPSAGENVGVGEAMDLNFELPIRFNEDTYLVDLRVSGLPGDRYGPDVSTWPEELVVLMANWN